MDRRRTGTLGRTVEKQEGAWAHEHRSTHRNREVFLIMAPSRNNLGKGTGSQLRNRVSVIAQWLRKRT